MNCPVCNNNEYETISRRLRHGMTGEVVLCKKCGVGFINNHPNKEWYAEFYGKTYMDEFKPDMTGNIVDKILPFLGRKVYNILEIGPGWGVNILSLAKYYPQARLYTIEPMPQVLIYLKYHGCTNICTDAESDWNIDIKFDVIIMRGVLEHLLKPIETLRRVREHLSPDGIIYILVPDCYRPRRPIKDYFFSIVHIWYFNIDTLRNKLRVSGLEIMTNPIYENSIMHCIVRRMRFELPPIINENVYHKQSKIFRDAIKRDRRPIDWIKVQLRKLLKDI